MPKRDRVKFEAFKMWRWRQMKRKGWKEKKIIENISLLARRLSCCQH